MGTTSATDYYVDANTGNDGDDGLSLVNAWLTLGHADGQLSAGDTLYLVDGTWTDELFVFAASGTSGNPITVTAYNGTPTMDCTNSGSSSNRAITTSTKDYINISNIKFTNYYRVIQSENSAHIHLDNLTVIYTGEQTIYFGQNVTYSSIKNCDLDGAHWNTILIGGGSDGACSHITIENTEIHNQYVHSHIDVYGDSYIIDNITIRGCTFYDTNMTAIYTHGSTWCYGGVDWIIEDNTAHGYTGNVIEVELKNSTITNNTIYNVTSPYAWTAFPIALTDGSENVTMDANNISDSEDTEYKIYDGDHTIIDAVGKSFRCDSGAGSSIELEFSNGKVFSENGGQNVYWYADKSNYSCSSESITITTYNITFMPTSGYGKDITVNTEQVNDVSNITANISAATTATMTFLVDNASNTYNLSVNDVYNSNSVSNSDSVVSFDYTFSSAVPTNFEVTWASTTGWSPGANSIYVGHRVRVYDNGTIEQRGNPSQESINITGLVVPKCT